MFGIGFTELLIIAIVAVLFIGPDKLPETMVEIAKFIKSIKKTIGDARSSLEEEIKIADLKEEALGFKKQLTDATSELQGFKNLNLDDFESKITYEEKPSPKADEPIATQIEPKVEHAQIKKNPNKPDPYAVADATPKSSGLPDEAKKGDA